MVYNGYPNRNLLERSSLMAVKKKYQITIPKPIAEQLEKVSKQKGLSKSILITLALENYLNQNNLNRKENVFDE